MRFDLSIPSNLTSALVPDITLMVGAMILLLAAAWGPDSRERQRSVGTAAIGLCVIVLGTIVFFMARGYSATAGMVSVDNFRWVADIVFLLATIGTIALSMDYNDREGIPAADAHVLVLFATSGMMILAAARDLTLIFLGIELMSVAVYILAGVNRRSGRSAEAALKYFLLGSFSTAFLLYGIALVYGASASTNLQVIGARVQSLGLGSSPMLLIGVGLLLVGFGFKVAAAPFHMWAPDVYEGAPTPITAYMAAAVKAAAFTAFLRLWQEAFAGLFSTWHSPVLWLAVITMVAGNLIALAQRNIKRMLAYSSIAHAGYILVAVAIGAASANSAFLFYIFAYTLATFGAFGVVVALGSPGESHLAIEDYSGLWTVRPWLASAMAIFMLALLGFPIFGGIGFFAKWYLLQAALQARTPQTALAIVLVVTSVVSAGYYLYVVVVMFMRPRREDAPTTAPSSALTRWVIGTAAVAILILGVFPNAIVALTRSSLPVAASSQVAGTALPR